jgi:hypothetical protein
VLATAAVNRTHKLTKERLRLFWAVCYYAGVLFCCAALVTTFMWSFRWLGPHETRLLASSPVVFLPNVSRVRRQSH